MAADLLLVGTRGTSVGSAANVSTGPGAVTAADALVLGVSHDPGVTVSSVVISGSGSDSFGAAKAALQGQGKLAVYVLNNATGGASVSVTVNFSGAGFATAHLLKGTGVAVSAYDAASLASSAADAATPWTLASGTPAQANNIWAAFLEQNGGSSGAYASSNFTLLSSEPDVSSFWTSGAFKLYSTSGASVTPSCTRTGSSNVASAMVVLALKETGGAPAVTARPLLLRGVG